MLRLQEVGVGVVVASALCAGCAQPTLKASAREWPEADALWQRAQAGAAGDFLGGDSAYSTSLGGERVLWLFGDSFIATDASKSRRHAKMVRNALAVQTGLDPSTASLALYAGGDVAGGAPSSFFHVDGGDLEETATWIWPGTPALVHGKLIVFQWVMKAKPGGGAFGFALDHTRAVVIDNPGDPPPAWRTTEVPLPAPPEAFRGYALGTGGALVDGDTLWLLAAREPGDHRMALAHVPASSAAHGDLSALTWVGDAGFNAQTELSLTHAKDAFEVVAVDGFVGDIPVSMRESPSLERPSFTPPAALFTPTLPQGAFDYSAKAHPELAGADVVVTYCTNGDLAAVVDDTGLYFPRFLRITLEKR